MMEPLFGSNPLPPGISSPGFGWFQLPLGFATRPPLSSGSLSSIPNVSLGPQTVPPSLSPEVYGYGGAAPAVGAPAFIGQSIAPPTFGVGAPALGIPEIATVHRLLTLVAMRRGQPFGPTNDHEIEDFIYDALDLIPGTSDVEVRCEGGRATFTGSVPHKRVKRDIGEIAWALPTLTDVQNNITIAARRRSRPPNREAEAAAAAGVRKPA